MRLNGSNLLTIIKSPSRYQSYQWMKDVEKILKYSDSLHLLNTNNPNQVRLERSVYTKKPKDNRYLNPNCPNKDKYNTESERNNERQPPSQTQKKFHDEKK